MKKLIPVNVTSDGCAFTIVSRYDGRASYLKSLMGGVDFSPLRGSWKSSQMSQKHPKFDD